MEQATPDPDTRLFDQLGVSLWRALNAWEEEMYARAADRGFSDLTAVDSEVLVWLPPGGMSISDLARRRGVSKQAMQQAVGGLESRGYVALTPDETDRRVRRVTYTGRGHAFVGALQAVKAEMQAEAERDFGTHKVHALMQDLTRIAQLWPDRDEA